MSALPQILVQRGPQRYGPYTVADVVSHHGARRLLGGDLAWHEGMNAWEPLGLVMSRLGNPLPAGTEKNAAYWMIPVGRSGWAIAAGYLGLFSVLGVFAPFAVACGVMGLRAIKKTPGLGGKGRAWFGIIAGGLMTAAIVVGLGISLFQS